MQWHREKKDKRTNSDLQNTNTDKKDQARLPPLKPNVFRKGKHFLFHL